MFFFYVLISFFVSDVFFVHVITSGVDGIGFELYVYRLII